MQSFVFLHEQINLVWGFLVSIVRSLDAC